MYVCIPTYVRVYNTPQYYSRTSFPWCLPCLWPPRNSCLPRRAALLAPAKGKMLMAPWVCTCTCLLMHSRMLHAFFLFYMSKYFYIQLLRYKKFWFFYHMETGFSSMRIRAKTYLCWWMIRAYLHVYLRIMQIMHNYNMHNYMIKTCRDMEESDALVPSESFQTKTWSESHPSGHKLQECRCLPALSLAPR